MIEIPMAHGHTALIDEKHQELLGWGRKWRPLVQKHTVYAIARLPRLDGKQRTMYMHRLIAGAQPGQKVLHIDRNGLNNTSANLRVVGAAAKPSPDQPTFLATGVTWDAGLRMWAAAIKEDDGTTTRVGIFDEEMDAVKMVEWATMRQHGLIGPPDSASPKAADAADLSSLIGQPWDSLLGD